MKTIKTNSQAGFSILAVILVIVAVIVAIGVWALSGQTNTSTSGNSSADIQAASIANDASAIKLAFDTMVINGASPDNIIFKPNDTSSNNVLSIANLGQLPRPNSNAIRQDAVAPDGVWTYSKNVAASSIGTSAPDFVILLSGVKDSVCQRINNSLYGDPTIPTYTGIAISDGFTSGSSTLNPNTTVALDFEGHGLPSLGWGSGCFKPSGKTDHNVYFRVLKAF